jgi:hypothetical protein
VKQGHYTKDAKVLASLPAPDVKIRHIGDLLHCSLVDLVPSKHSRKARVRVV